MKQSEFWLGVCIYAAILLASFSSRLYPLMNKPLIPGIETIWRSKISANHIPLSPLRLKGVPVREELKRG